MKRSFVKKTTLLGVLVVTPAVLFSTGCTSLLKTGSINEAYENFEAADYEETLENIALARNIGEPSAELIAELTYLQAQTYEQMGRTEAAETLYRYLNEQHHDTQYGYLAAAKLGHDDG